MDLSIIIVNWNSRDYLAKCLTSIYRNAPDLHFEVVVVDNASFDGCAEMLAKQFPEVKFIQSESNLGFAGANNLGFHHSSGNTLLFLNPDTEVIGDAIAVLFDAAQSLPAAGIVGARLLNTDGTIQTSCIQRFPTILNQAFDVEVLRNAFPKLAFWGMRPLLEKQHQPVAVEVISGACMMVWRERFAAVGLFTTAYFMYCEDVDLCFKLRKANLKNHYIDSATVVHHGGGSTSTDGEGHFSAIVMRDSIARFFHLRHGGLCSATYRATVVLSSIVRCSVLLCGLILSSQRRRLLRVLSRWIAILRWSIGMNSGTPVPVAPNSMRTTA